MKTIDTAGGPPVSVAQTTDYRGGSWGAGVILYSAGATGPIMKVPASGGAATPATTLHDGEAAHARPTFLPDGRRFLFRVYDRPLYVGSIDDGERRVILDNPQTNNAAYAAGHLLYVSDSMLVARPFDLRTLTFTGESVRVVGNFRSRVA